MKLLELELSPIEVFAMQEIESEQKTFVAIKGKEFVAQLCQN